MSETINQTGKGGKRNGVLSNGHSICEFNPGNGSHRKRGAFMNTKPDFKALLLDAVREPGKMLEAYRAFYQFSTGNQLLALSQCVSRNIPVTPIATFKAWQSKGRNVRKGEKAISLSMPITIKKEITDKVTGEVTNESFSMFKLVPRWFAMAQTDGTNAMDVSIPGWNRKSALEALNVREIPFETLSGNTQGYAQRLDDDSLGIAINPLAQLPSKTTFHELAHCVLGHLAQGEIEKHDGSTLPMNLMEVEAESVAMLCLASLDLPGIQYCRGYIQSWLGENRVIEEKSARRIFSAVDKILKAGQPVEEKKGDES